MTTLIIGSQGLVGSALKKLLPEAIEGVQLETKDKQQVYIDITKYETLFKVFSIHRPNVVYLPAAITNVDKCEDISTNLVNIKGATTVLRLCEQFESKLVYFSSSYVFDGESEFPYDPLSETNPINNYGMQKATTESLILQGDCEALIVRTVGVFGTEKLRKNFGKAVVSNIFAGKKVFVPKDQYMNPINSHDLAEVTIKLASKYTGIFHVAGDTCTTKSDFARRIAKYFGLEHLVIPVPSSEMKQRAKRPKMGCLDSYGLEEVGISVPSLDSGILHFLQTEYNA
jgi:dTDP-4-dehydrorhamnose reductase